MKHTFSKVAALTVCMASLLSVSAWAKDAFKAGTYTSTEKGLMGDITVTTTFSKTRIEKINVKSNETPALGGAAMDKLSKQAIDKQSLKLDAVSGSTISSKAFLKALEANCSKAGGNLNALKK